MATVIIAEPVVSNNELLDIIENLKRDNDLLKKEHEELKKFKEIFNLKKDNDLLRKENGELKKFKEIFLKQNKTVGWTIIKNTDTFTHKFVETNKSVDSCKLICKEKNYGGFTNCIYKHDKRTNGYMFNKSPDEGIINMINTTTDKYSKINPGITSFIAELYISPGASIQLLKDKELQGFEIIYDKIDREMYLS
jgi:hypothetical protein